MCFCRDGEESSAYFSDDENSPQSTVMSVAKRVNTVTLRSSSSGGYVRLLSNCIVWLKFFCPTLAHCFRRRRCGMLFYFWM